MAVTGVCYSHNLMMLERTTTATAPQRVDVNAPTWSIGLAEAALCADLGCNAVFTLRRGECPRCAGRNFVSLETLMVRR